MNRRKQTKPKRTTCSSERVHSVESSISGEKKLSELISEERSRDSSPGLMDGEEEESRGGSGCSEEMMKATPVSASDSTRNFQNVSRKSLKGSPASPESPEFTNHRSHFSPSDAENCEGNGFAGKAGRGVCAETTESRKDKHFVSENLLPSSDRTTPVSVSGSEKDLDLTGGCLREYSTPINRTVIPNAMTCQSSGSDFAATEQNFVQQLESFVASMDQQTKRKTDKASDSLRKFSTHEFDKTRELKKILRDNEGSKYLFDCYSPPHLDLFTSDQPLDLSISSRDTNKKPFYHRNHSMSLTEPVLGSNSLLASLEQKFGEHSQILDRVGSLPRACHLGASSLHPLSRESHLYASKLSETGKQLTGCRKNLPYLTDANSFCAGFRSNEVRLNRKEKTGKDNGNTMIHQTEKEELPAVGNNIRTASNKDSEQVDSAEEKKSRSSTSLRCSCKMEFDRLYLLTVHLQETGHKPSSVRHSAESSLDNTKLVRGQDVWLNSGSEQTRQILRCMECHRSFRSLPELTVHMIQTEHYMNLVQPELTPRRPWTEPGSSSSGSESIEQFSCHFCSKAFEDADALGLHIVTYGHYRRDQKPMSESSAGGGGGGGGGLSFPFSCANENDDRHLETETVASLRSNSVTDDCDCVRRSHDSKIQENLNPDKTTTKSLSSSDDQTEVVQKIPRLEPGQRDLAFSPNSHRTFGGETNVRSAIFHHPHHHHHQHHPDHHLSPPASTSEATDGVIEKQEFLNDRSTEDVTQEPQDHRPDKESALTAMQSFINRSFGHFQSSKPGAEKQQVAECGRSPLTHKSLLSSSSSSSWQPVRSFLRKLSLADPSASRSNRKRHHHQQQQLQQQQQQLQQQPECDNRMRREVVDPLRLRDDVVQRRNDGRRVEERVTRENDSSSCVDPFWKTNPRKSQSVWDERLRKPSEASVLGFSIQSFGGISSGRKIVTSPVTPPTAVSPMNDASPSRKLDLSTVHEKEEMTSQRQNGNEPSTLESLQELVYRRSVKGVDLQAPSMSPYLHQVTDRLSQSQALFISTKNPMKKSIPETLILVNPIVTVVPGSGGAAAAAAGRMGCVGGSSLSIMLSPHHSPDTDLLKETVESRPSSSPAAVDSVDSDVECSEFKCRTCKRNFASKGSYRYHRSRYHAYPDLDRSRSKDQSNAANNRSHRNSESTNKFSKYYQLANELSGKSN